MTGVTSLYVYATHYDNAPFDWLLKPKQGSKRLVRGHREDRVDPGGGGGGGAGTPTHDPICLHLNVPTTWWLKTDTQCAYFNEWKSLL